jgi:hypothetical protein
MPCAGLLGRPKAHGPFGRIVALPDGSIDTYRRILAGVRATTGIDAGISSIRSINSLAANSA